jgi:hypothetical protein
LSRDPDRMAPASVAQAAVPRRLSPGEISQPLVLHPE